MNNLLAVFLCSIFVGVSGCAVYTQHGEGFVAGTIVKTPQGYAVIEELKVGDRVISYDDKHHELREDVISQVHKPELDHIVELVVDSVRVRAGPTQKFYCHDDSAAQWVMAQNLQVNERILLGSERWASIGSTARVEQRTSVYSISTVKHHNFFVSNHDILTHNIVFVVGAIAAFDLVIEIAAPAIAFGAICLYCKLTGKKLFCPFTIQPPNDNDWNHILNNNRHDHGFDGKDPKKIWNHAQLILIAAMDRDEIRDNALYRVSGATEYGAMEIKGIVIDGVVRISTMYMKGGQ